MGREQEDDEAARAEPAPDPVQAAPATEERARGSIVERGGRQGPAGGRHGGEERGAGDREGLEGYGHAGSATAGRRDARTSSAASARRSASLPVGVTRRCAASR